MNGIQKRIAICNGCAAPRKCQRHLKCLDAPVEAPKPKSAASKKKAAK